MSNLNYMIWLSNATVALTMASGLFALGTWQALPFVLIWVVVFISGWILKWRWVPEFLLLSGSSILGYCCALGVSVFWMLVGISALLLMWDLSRLRLLFGQYQQVENEQAIFYSHLKWLGQIIGMSFLLVFLSRLINLRMMFGTTVFFGIVVMVGLSLLFRNLRKNIG